jgi:membrane protease YdiL (CAAX protease family)
MPVWPGPLLGIGGAVLAAGALGAAGAADTGGLPGVDATTVGWIGLVGVLAFAAGLVYAAVRQLRVRRFLPVDRYRGPSILILLALVLVLSAVLTAPFGADAAALLLGGGELTLLGSIVLLVGTQASLLLVSWLFVLRPNALAGMPGVDARHAGRAVRTGLGWGLVAWVGASILSDLVVIVLEALGIDAAPQAAEQALEVIDPWLAIASIVVLAPIAEEVFFRGIGFNALLRERGRRWAYLGSAALFAVIHLSLVALLPIFLLGLALAWVYERTGNLLAPIAMHAVVNGISVLFALLIRYEVIDLPTAFLAFR